MLYNYSVEQLVFVNSCDSVRRVGILDNLDPERNLDPEYTCDSHKLYKQHCLHIDGSAKFKYISSTYSCLQDSYYSLCAT